MHSSCIYITSTTPLGNLENFLESARGKTIVIEDKHRKSTASIRLGIREKDGDNSERTEDQAQTRQALYQAITTVLESQKHTAGLSFLKKQASGNCDALFIAGTTQLTLEVLENLFQNNPLPQTSQPVYKTAVPLHVIEGTLTPQEYLNFPDTAAFGPELKSVVEKTKKGEFALASDHPAYSATFIADFGRHVNAKTCILEALDGNPKICTTLTDFIDFCNSGNQEHARNKTDLSVAVSSMLSQNLPIFFHNLIFKSASTPIKSAKNEPLFFSPSFKGATFHLKKMADGGIKMTYNGTCKPEKIRRNPGPMAPSEPLPQPGMFNMVCNLTFKPNGEVEYGNVRFQAKGMTL